MYKKNACLLYGLVAEESAEEFTSLGVPFVYCLEPSFQKILLAHECVIIFSCGPSVSILLIPADITLHVFMRAEFPCIPKSFVSKVPRLSIPKPSAKNGFHSLGPAHFGFGVQGLGCLSKINFFCGASLLVNLYVGTKPRH